MDGEKSDMSLFLLPDAGLIMSLLKRGDENATPGEKSKWKDKELHELSSWISSKLEKGEEHQDLEPEKVPDGNCESRTA